MSAALKLLLLGCLVAATQAMTTPGTTGPDPLTGLAADNTIGGLTGSGTDFFGIPMDPMNSLPPMDTSGGTGGGLSGSSGSGTGSSSNLNDLLYGTGSGTSGTNSLDQLVTGLMTSDPQGASTGMSSGGNIDLGLSMFSDPNNMSSTAFTGMDMTGGVSTSLSTSGGSDMLAPGVTVSDVNTLLRQGADTNTSTPTLTQGGSNPLDNTISGGGATGPGASGSIPELLSMMGSLGSSPSSSSSSSSPSFSPTFSAPSGFPSPSSFGTAGSPSGLPRGAASLGTAAGGSGGGGSGGGGGGGTTGAQAMNPFMTLALVSLLGGGEGMMGGGEGGEMMMFLLMNRMAEQRRRAMKAMQNSLTPSKPSSSSSSLMDQANALMRGGGTAGPMGALALGPQNLLSPGGAGAGAGASSPMDALAAVLSPTPGATSPGSLDPALLSGPVTGGSTGTAPGTDPNADLLSLLMGPSSATSPMTSGGTGGILEAISGGGAVTSSGGSGGTPSTGGTGGINIEQLYNSMMGAGGATSGSGAMGTSPIAGMGGFTI